MIAETKESEVAPSCLHPREERPRLDWRRHQYKKRVYWQYYLRRAKQAITVTELPTAVPRADLEERFRAEAERWQRETSHMSSPLQRMLHTSYQVIMGMAAEGPEAKEEIVRLMLHDIKHQHRDWLVALGFLTQENPIDPRDAGRTDKIVKAWLRWAEQRGIHVA